MRSGTCTTLLALAGGAAACIHGDALYARGPGPSIGSSARFVPSLWRRQNRNQVNIFFGQIQNVNVEMFGCFAGGSDDQDKIPRGIKPQSVNLGNEGFDPNLDLGVMVYYIKASQNSVFMFDTSTAKVLADSCNQALTQQTGFSVDNVILSHEHGDHVSGLGAQSLQGKGVIAQDSIIKNNGGGGGRNVALRQGQSQTFNMQDGVMNVTNVQAHTQLGTVAMINGLALMGDESESTLNFLVSQNTQKQKAELDNTLAILNDNGIQQLLPAHGSGQAMFQGQFDLSLLQSNQAYLDTMAKQTQLVCPQNGNQQRKGRNQKRQNQQRQGSGRQQGAQQGGQQGGGQQVCQQNNLNGCKANLANAIGVQVNDITDAYFNSHINENCKTVAGKQN
ncbi:hypothetical protein CDD83_10657 [Cordyceps sp. RAO-2017]|nr:hypothetical protein CDD83_10657 [Cordyceps sp. RAO-2017]